jgi:trehalose 6-phosphate phosphatase
MTATLASERLAPPEPWVAAGTALFLDLDGVLAAIEARPQDVEPLPWRSRLLRRLVEQLDGRLAIVSGRTLEEVDRILDGAVPAVGAVHGLVRRRSDGRLGQPAASAGLAKVRNGLGEIAIDHPTLMLENKGVAVALHYRQAPELGPTVRAEAGRLAREHGMKLQLGDMVAEVREPGSDKGGAVRAFMQEAPFKGARPIFLGDDLTDEDGFAAAQALGGMGVLVGPGRKTAARRRLDDVGAVRAWLEAGLAQGARP